MLERNFFKDWYDWVLERSRGSGNVRQWGHWQPNWASHTGRSLERRQRPAWLLTEPTTAGSTFHWWPAEDFSDLLCRTAELPLRNSKLWSANWLGPFFLKSREQRAWLDLLYDGRQKFHVERWECWRSLWTTVQNVLYSVMFEVLIRLVQTWQSSVSHLALHYYDFKFPSQNCLYQIPLPFRESQWNVEFECKVYSESPLITKILDPQKTFLLLELSRVELNWTSGLIIPSQAAVDNFPALGNVGSKNSRNRQIRPHVKKEGKGWTEG